MTRRSSSSRRTTFGALAGAGGSPTRHASIHGSDHTAGTPPATRSASCAQRVRQPSGRVGDQHQPQQQHLHVPGRPFADRALRRLQPVRVRARDQHHARRRLTPVGGQRPAVTGRARAEEQLLQRRLPRPAVRAQPPHRRPLARPPRCGAAAGPRAPAGRRLPGRRPRQPHPSKPPSAERRSPLAASPPHRRY